MKNFDHSEGCELDFSESVNVFRLNMVVLPLNNLNDIFLMNAIKSSEQLMTLKSETPYHLHYCLRGWQGMISEETLMVNHLNCIHLVMMKSCHWMLLSGYDPIGILNPFCIFQKLKKLTCFIFLWLTVTPCIQFN